MTTSGITDYHAKYFAHDLTRQASRETLEGLSMALFDANVDLNPHQIEAALFAMRSPVSKGVILADEVGLGKTIEAALVLCQLWAERKRKLLVICPASIRKQWAVELEEKFNLPATILDTRSYNASLKAGVANPFENGSVVICSLNFAAKMKVEIRSVGWDLVVIDEAHKLRNAHQPNNKIGQAIRFGTEGTRKILMTATPLQNSLMELYGMSSVIDEYIFGEAASYRAQYVGSDPDLDDLKSRLKSFCKRTLRKDVLVYVPYTNRKAITRPFNPADNEQNLYDAISKFLQRADTFSIPSRQRTLLTLRLRKILASSSHAIAGTLEIIKERLLKLRDGLPEDDLVDKIIAGEDLDDDELFEGTLDFGDDDGPASEAPAIDVDKLDKEIAEIDQYIRWSRSVGVDAKSRALLSSLEIGFARMSENGAAKKALIFTESRRTQTYIRDFLEANGYAGKVATFNGSNTDEASRKITNRWKEENRTSGQVTGSRDVDTRTAIISCFREDAEILVATEAAAEGVNLQFCSLVVNYDLPWNPQRVEQRIGRCHRYGQKHDVVVINFVNERNAADQRTFELLSSKFQLFDGVFGASDDVLGTIESGVDFEKSIFRIYQECRTPQQIEDAFKKLREELDSSIKARMESTRRLLLEFFDEEIHQRLRLQMEGAKQQLDRVGRQFWSLSKHMIGDDATFNDDALTFLLHRIIAEAIRPGSYHLISKEKDKDNIVGEFLYRLSHPLGEYVLEQAKSLKTPVAEVTFNITKHPNKITVVEELKGSCGWLTLDKLVISSFDNQEHLLFSGITDHGRSLDQEIFEKMFLCVGNIADFAEENLKPERLAAESSQHHKSAMNVAFEASNRFMNEERERLEKWADDMIFAAEKDLKDIKSQLREQNRLSRQVPTVDEQHAMQNKIRDLEMKQRQLRQRIFDVEGEIIDKRNTLINVLEKRMQQKTHVENLFTIRWSVV